MALRHKDTTLGDVANTDKDNFLHINGKENKTFRFLNEKDAQVFRMKAFDTALRRLGVKIRRGMDKKRIDRLLLSRGVIVEHREYAASEEVYRSGFFIYKTAKYEESHRAERELVYYVSNPYIKDTGYIILLKKTYYVTTNVKFNRNEVPC